MLAVSYFRKIRLMKTVFMKQTKQSVICRYNQWHTADSVIIHLLQAMNKKKTLAGAKVNRTGQFVFLLLHLPCYPRVTIISNSFDMIAFCTIFIAYQLEVLTNIFLWNYFYLKWEYQNHQSRNHQHESISRTV